MSSTIDHSLPVSAERAAQSSGFSVQKHSFRTLFTELIETESDLMATVNVFFPVVF